MSWGARELEQTAQVAMGWARLQFWRLPPLRHLYCARVCVVVFVFGVCVCCVVCVCVREWDVTIMHSYRGRGRGRIGCVYMCIYVYIYTLMYICMFMLLVFTHVNRSAECVCTFGFWVFSFWFVMLPHS